MPALYFPSYAALHEQYRSTLLFANITHLYALRTSMKLVKVFALACLAAVAAAQEGCTDVRPGFGFFSPSCSYRKDRGDCKDLVAQGYCLETCGACKETPEPIATPEEAAPEVAEAPTADDTEDPPAETQRETITAEEKKKQEEMYREQLLDQVSMIEEDDGDVEVLPELLMPPEEATVNLAPEPEVDTKPNLPIVCSSTVLKDLKNDLNLTTAYKAAQALNLADVLERNDIIYTFFVPDDAAWEAGAENLGLTVDELLEKPGVLAKIFFSGIIPDMILDEDALDLTETMQSQSGEMLTFAYGNGVYTVSILPDTEATIVDAEKYVGCNYMIHVIDNVLV